MEELKLKNEMEKAKEFVIGEFNGAMEEEEGSRTAKKKILKSPNINVDSMELNEAPKARNISVGDIVIISNSEEDSLEDLKKVLMDISKNKSLMKYLKNEKGNQSYID